MNEVPIEKVREFLRLDEATGKLFWIKSTRGGPMPGTEAGGRNVKGYRCVKVASVCLLVHRVVWLLHYGRWPTVFIDHVNRDRNDNRIENLREATHAQNRRNGGAYRNNRIGVRGVTLTEKGKFRARIRCDGRMFNIGTFANLSDAESAYAKAAKERHGPFASSHAIH